MATIRLIVVLGLVLLAPAVAADEPEQPPCEDGTCRLHERVAAVGGAMHWAVDAGAPVLDRWMAAASDAAHRLCASAHRAADKAAPVVDALVAKAADATHRVADDVQHLRATLVGDEWDAVAGLAGLDSAVCSIVRHRGPIGDDEFAARFADAPVVLERLTDNARFREMTRKGVLLTLYGDSPVVLSTANTFSYTKVSKPLREYVRDDMPPRDDSAEAESVLYHFGDNRYSEWPGFYEAYVRPPLRHAPINGSLSFGVAGTGSGVPFHTHGAVFAEVLHGRKRWFLYPPGPAPEFDPNRTTLYWLRNVYPHAARRPLECMLAPGEVLYLPSHWWHATLNIGETVFMSTFV